MSDQYKDEETLFRAAARLKTPAERRAYIEQVCGDDPALLARLTSLLKAHDAEHPLLDALMPECDVAIDGPAVSEGPGTAVGRYKLLEKIGEGGMAVVYMAESATGGPIRRKVALKIIKLGMDTQQVIARFEAERQALALMDHPCIAKVHDAGATDTGRPYFVMELVQGVSITEYCDRNNLSTKDRLGLFIQVCNAVQHAHQKGIIHRDLKPSNVMVTRHDGKPVPKVIDFGIAKATNQKLTEKTLFTRYAHLIGTPAYMSPEQAELSDLDIDTRSDIYSLGVLLYQLLTGTTPFSEEELRKAGYIEMQRVIREQEPVKPSTRIRTALRRVSVPARRGTGILPVVLRGEGILPLLFPHRGQDARETQGRDALATRSTPYQQVRGDLDWIVMKTLEKDRARRYDTASGLAEDIRRHLQHEPVVARGPSSTYRLRKFLRRHRVEALAVVTMAVVAAVMVVTLSVWSQARRQLSEAEGFRHQAEGLRHKETLSQAREQYAKAEREAALETIKPILDSRHVGPEARLLQATILVDNRRSDEAAAILANLLDEKPEIAGAAHSLLARILWESESPNAEKLKEIEEHRRQAETLLPQTAEACFLRAITAATIREQLTSLNRALQLDPAHYESRRLRAFTHYASRKHEKMKDDALAMVVLKPRDPLGYSLYAMAWRELGRFEEAIAEYDSAIARTLKDSPDYVDLSTQRCEVLLRMGSYERVVLEGQAYLSQSRAKDLSLLQHHVFCALTAQDDYDKATDLFRQMMGPDEESRRLFRARCRKYVYATLRAGRSWHPPGPAPTGATFLPLVEAEEIYQALSAKATPIDAEGFNAHWSPDGKKLAYSLGARGASGVAVYDLTTKDTELLILAGRDPKWSPDGRYIAFVRDRQFLQIPELLTAEYQERLDREIWVMKSDGTEPRRLAHRGNWPSWGKDSTCVYFATPYTLKSISIEGREAEPESITPCPAGFPSVSPDNRYLAYVEDSRLKVKDLASQAVVAQWSVPFRAWGGPGWSPMSDELCLGVNPPPDEGTGLWIFRLGHSEPLKTLDGTIMNGVWAPDGTKLAFDWGRRIWVADLDPNVSASEALGPSRTMAEHLRGMVAFYTRRIEADPRDAYAYSDRARHYYPLNERAKANADVRRWSAVMRGQLPLDLFSATARTPRCVINMPFDCQLVFSAERPVNVIPMTSVAFGQKGRCEMKLFEIPTVVTSLLGLCLFSGLHTAPAHGDFTFDTPTLAVPSCADPSITTDGLTLFTANGGSAYGSGAAIWVHTRETIQDDWGPPVDLGPTVNRLALGDGGCPQISANSLTLYFDSVYPGLGGRDIWVTTRPTIDGPWSEPANLGAPVNSPYYDAEVTLSADGLSLYFGSNRPGSYGDRDIWLATRETVDSPWSQPHNLGPVVNTSAYDNAPSLSTDGRVLFFSSTRPGGSGGRDLWMTRRATTADPWPEPVNLGPIVNSPSLETAPCISADGTTLYFYAPGGVWQTKLNPIVDFNADEKVDLADLVMLIDNWGMNKTLCDIGPMPWGDGKVDIEDLKVFVAEWEKENPAALVVTP